MAKYFLGSVGKAEAFRRKDDGNLELAFVSKTLTDSGLNISTTKDDIRAGQGAPIQFSFYHDPSVEITLTDVLWNREYLTAQLGATFDKDPVDYKTKKIKFTAGSATLDEAVLEMPIPCEDTDPYLAWVAPVGSDEWKIAAVSGEGHNQLYLAGASGDYCVRYLAASDKAHVAEITSMIIPEELFLIITAPIFAGDACAASKGKAAGHITFEVPRFQLNGAQEFSMNMSQNQTMSLAGTALASTSADCDAMGGKLLRIIEVFDDYNYKADVSNLIIAEECLVVGEIPMVYAEMKDGSVRKLNNSDLTFAPALDNEGKFATATDNEVVTLVRDAKFGGNIDEAAVVAARTPEEPQE